MLCRLWLVARCPAYVCCRLNMPEFMCRAVRRLELYRRSRSGYMPCAASTKSSKAISAFSPCFSMADCTCFLKYSSAPTLDSLTAFSEISMPW